MKRFSTCFVLTVVFAVTFATGNVLTGGGLRAGLTFGRLQAENAPTLNTGYGVGIGLMLGCGLSKNLSVVSGLDMTDMGLGYYKNYAEEEVSIRNGLLSVPLAIRFLFAESFPLYLALGGHFELPFYSKAEVRVKDNDDSKGYAIKGRSFTDIGVTAGFGYEVSEATNIDIKYVYNINPPFDEKIRDGAGKNSLSSIWAGVSIVTGLYRTETRDEKKARIKAEAGERDARRKAMEARDAEREARVMANPTGFGVTTPSTESRTETEQVLLESGMIVLDAVYFETGKAEIHRNSKPYLTTIAKMLVKYPKLRLEIGGHTDNTGNLQGNMTLSQQRADAVSVFMRGVEPSLAGMLSAKGYGPTAPKADNSTADGRETNRRVELKVMNPEVLAEYK